MESSAKFLETFGMFKQKVEKIKLSVDHIYEWTNGELKMKN